MTRFSSTQAEPSTPNSSPLHHVLDALERGGFNPRSNGRGWTARCPAHPDRTPSLRIAEGQDGAALLHCFAGCEPAAVLATLGLELHDLFEPRPFRVGSRREQRRPVIRPEPSRPPRREVLRVWGDCRPFHEDCEASAWAASRGLDPLLIADRDLARALPARASVPWWARCGGRSWVESGHRIVLPLFDHRGELVSLHARAVRPEAEPKGLSPAGYSVRVSAFADDVGQALLRGDASAGCVWIPEGGPDFLSVAIAWGADADVATLGIIAGSWGIELGQRIPAGSRVVIAVDHDGAGMKYADAIARTLAGRVALERWIPPRELAS